MCTGMNCDGTPLETVCLVNGQPISANGLVTVSAGRDVFASKLEQTTMERIKARNERDRYRQQRDALKTAVRLMWNRVPVVEHDYAALEDKLAAVETRYAASQDALRESFAEHRQVVDILAGPNAMRTSVDVATEARLALDLNEAAQRALITERDRLAATVGRLAGFIGTCRNCCEVYDGRCRKGREVPGLAALGGRKEG
jgi:hypothetical protein